MNNFLDVVQIERPNDDILVMTLNRPAKRNGITPFMWEQLICGYEELERDEALRVGILRAAGDHFTGGMDLPLWRERSLAGEGILLTPSDRLDPLGLTSVSRTKPIVVAIEGICFTIGVELALASDIVIAGAGSRFSQLEVKRGVIAFGGASIRMARRAGWGNAMSVLLTGDEFDAETAMRFGFVQKVAPDGGALGAALDIARRIAAAAPLAVRSTLQNSRIALEVGLHQATSKLEESMRALLQTENAMEGAASFAERRAAVFKGR